MQPPVPTIHPHEDADSRALFRAAVAMLAFTVFAFAQKLAVVPERIERYDTLVVVHAASMLAWLGLFCVQTGAVRRGAMRLHKTLGAFSPVIVVVAIVSGFRTTRQHGAEMEVTHIFLGNMVHLGAFGGLYAMAVTAALLHRIDWHRRAMFLASFATLTPPLSRVTQTLGLPNGAAAALHIAAICAIPVAWDLLQRRRLHPATLTGLGLVFGLLTGAAAFGTIPPLAAWTRSFVLSA